MGSFVGRGNQYTQLVKVCIVNCRPMVRNYHLSNIGSRVRSLELRGGRGVCYSPYKTENYDSIKQNLSLSICSYYQEKQITLRHKRLRKY